jgi:hypothetical protein
MERRREGIQAVVEQALRGPAQSSQ